jgi:tetratricopeptide (TPR) repeat protein
MRPIELGRGPARRFHHVGALCLALAALPACAGSLGARPRTPSVAVPASLDAASFKLALSSYRRLAPGDAERAPLRGKLIGYVLSDDGAHPDDAYTADVEKLAVIASLYQPDELREVLPAELLPLVKDVRKGAEKRGEEGRAQAALWYEGRLQPEAGEPREQLALLERFSVEARQHLPVGERYRGLIDVVRERARLAPSPDTLKHLADLYVEQRERLLAAIRPSSEDGAAPPEISFQEYREATTALSRSPLDIAAVYLLHGDFASAAERLAQLVPITRLEPRVRFMVQAVVDDRPEARDTLMALSLDYDEQDARDVARALCNFGLRKFPEDARFPRCLGHLAAKDDDYMGATREYASAIRLSPDDRSLYDEALSTFSVLMRGELFDTDPTETRALASEAREILAQRLRRFPEVPSNMSVDELELIEGLAELSAGNTDAAIAHFKKSLELKDNLRALLQLAQVELRVGDLGHARSHLQTALERTTRRDLAEIRQRAQIVEQLGDVARYGGEVEQARTSYGEALALWEAAVRPGDDGATRAFGHIRRGVLLSRLGRDADAKSAFEHAMEAAPDNRETYGQVLAHWVMTGTAPSDAEAVYRRAQRELTLDAEWRAYYGLWVTAVSARAGAPVDPAVTRQLAHIAKADAWWAQLVQLSLGQTSHAELSARAKNAGERAEADFYEAVRLLGQKKTAEARALLQQVMASRMIGFYEYQMAQELLSVPEARMISTPAP